MRDRENLVFALSTPARILLALAVFALAFLGTLELVGREIHAHPGSAPYWAMGSLAVSNLALMTSLFMMIRSRSKKQAERRHG
jgi:hypothetical protein